MCEDASVADYLELSNDSHHWDVIFIGDALDSAVDVYAKAGMRRFFDVGVVDL